MPYCQWDFPGSLGATPTGGPVGAWRGNEPSGFTQLAARDFDATSEDGWSVGAAGGSTANFTIVTDPTAPRSPSNIGQINYPTSPTPWSDGSAEPCIVFKSANLRKLYFCMAHKFSTNWVGHPSGTNKILHLHSDTTGTSNRIVIVGRGDADTPIAPVIALQGLAANFDFVAQGGGFGLDVSGWLFPNKAGHIGDTVTRGRWDQYEALCDLGTPGVADGAVKMWFNGALIIDYINIPLCSTTALFSSQTWAPTWGGSSGATLTVDQQQFMDAYYSSASN